MEGTPHITLTRWLVGQYEERELALASAEDLDEAIRSIVDEDSVVLWLAAGDHALAVAASHGDLTVMVQLGDDEFYDLVGEATAHGTFEMGQGGQWVDVPCRHRVSLPAAIHAAHTFFETGTVDVSRDTWERQGRTAL